MADYLTVREVAAIYNVHEMTVRRHIAAGRLRAVRVGRSIRVRPEDLTSYEEAQPRAQRGWRPITASDTLLKLIGIVSDPRSAWVSGDKYAALAEAYMPEP